MILLQQLLNEAMEILEPPKDLEEQVELLLEFYERHQSTMEKFKNHYLVIGNSEMFELFSTLQDEYSTLTPKYNPATYNTFEETLFEKILQLLSDIVDWFKEQLGFKKEYEFEGVDSLFFQEEKATLPKS
jgi:hypothetical protein